MTEDTIFAPATAAGRAGIAVIRISGPRAGTALERMSGRQSPAPRRALYCRLTDPATGADLDAGLAVWFPGPASFTGEDVVEFHVHGGRATIQAVCAALGDMAGFRFAEPGEFTRRAFHNGKLDLSEVEGLADLVAAETEAQRRQALRQLHGGLGQLCEAWRAELVQSLALIEAEIDFPEEGLPDSLARTVKHNIYELSEQISQHLDDNRRGERIRDGLFIAILGAPNVGKSSLLNLLAQRDAVIVSDEPGTTRDVVDVHLDIAGYAVTLADTAGLRDPVGKIEREGIRRALERAATADLRLVVVDAGETELNAQAGSLLRPGDICLFNKMDLHPDTSPPPELAGCPVVALSARTGENVDVLLDAIASRAVALLSHDAGAPLTRERHRLCLEECRAALVRGTEAALPELMAEDLRLAARALGRVTGRVDVDEVLDVIFREFCIGK